MTLEPEDPVGAVGVVGLGAMGSAVARRLLDADFDVTVFNRTARKADPFARAGANVAETPAAVVRRSDIVITCLFGPDTDRIVYLGESGLLTGDVAGRLFVNTSTCGPDLACELASETEKRGAAYLDCPLLGGSAIAEAGELVVPVGGSAEALHRAHSTLSAFSARVQLVGPVGSGQVVKLVNNLHALVTLASLGEVLRIALRAGVDPRALAAILPRGSSRSLVMDHFLEPLLQRRHGIGEIPMVVKDVALGLELAQATGEGAPISVAAQQVWERVVDRGLEAHGFAALVE